jgi:hypothetical protein
MLWGQQMPQTASNPLVKASGARKGTRSNSIGTDLKTDNFDEGTITEWIMYWLPSKEGP